jgi:hypothetical protein
MRPRRRKRSRRRRESQRRKPSHHRERGRPRSPGTRSRRCHNPECHRRQASRDRDRRSRRQRRRPRARHSGQRSRRRRLRRPARSRARHLRRPSRSTVNHLTRWRLRDLLRSPSRASTSPISSKPRLRIRARTLPPIRSNRTRPRRRCPPSPQAPTPLLQVRSRAPRRTSMTSRRLTRRRTPRVIRARARR